MNFIDHGFHKLERYGWTHTHKQTDPTEIITKPHHHYHHHHIFYSISKTNDNNNAPEQPTDRRMKKGQQG